MKPPPARRNQRGRRRALVKTGAVSFLRREDELILDRAAFALHLCAERELPAAGHAPGSP